MRVKRWIPVMALMAFLLAGCNTQQPQPAPQLQEPVGLLPDTATAYVGELYNMMSFDSKVVSYVEELFFSMDGVIATVYCYPGMEVEAGEVLAELDIASVETQLRQLTEDIEYTKTTNEYTNTLLQLDIEMLQSQLRQLQQSGTSQEIALKENEIAQKQAILNQNQAMQELELQEMQQQMEKLQAALQNNVLRAPFAGRVLSGTALQTGQRVKAFETVAFLADESKLHLSGAFIKESYLKIADRVYAHIGANQYEIQMRPMDSQEYLAAVLAGKTVNTEFDLVGPENLLFQVEAGQYAAICIITDYVENALLVPTQAVLQDAQGSYVYVAEDGNHIRRNVKVGQTTSYLTQILEGLQEGEVVYVQ